MSYVPGDRITAALDVTVTAYGQINATTRVEEESGVAHYIYLDSAEVRKAVIKGYAGRAAPQPGERLRLEFEAQLGEPDPSYVPREGTPVEITGVPYYVHYLNLDSPGIAKAGADRKTGRAEKGTSMDEKIIDSRSIQLRIEELQDAIAPFKVKMPGTGKDPVGEFASFDEALDFRNERPDCAALIVTEVIDEEKNRELDMLLELRSSVDSLEWDTGITLVREDYFDEYAKQEARDLGLITSTQGWPFDYIDWEAAADALAEDYTTVTFGGSDYLYRS